MVTLRYYKNFETIKEILLRPNHVIEAQQFDVDLLNSIFSTAQEMEQVVQHCCKKHRSCGDDGYAGCAALPKMAMRAALKV